jgi:hypothetical protein
MKKKKKKMERERARALLTLTATRCSGKSTRVAYTLPHPIWQNEYVDAVEVNHTPPENLTDKLALYTVRLMRYMRLHLLLRLARCCSHRTRTHTRHTRTRTHTSDSTLTG